MGKGDIKTRRGKIINGTFGVARPHTAPQKTAESRSQQSDKTASSSTSKKPVKKAKKTTKKD